LSGVEQLIIYDCHVQQIKITRFFERFIVFLGDTIPHSVKVN